MTLKSELEKLAGAVAKKAQDDKTPLLESVDALKALTGLYSALLKDKNPVKEIEEGDTFDTFAAGITGQSTEPANGRKPPLRSR